MVAETIGNIAKSYLEELFADFDGEYIPEEINWGEPVGGEIW